MFYVDSYGITDAGCWKDYNQDDYLVANLNKSMQIHQSSLIDEDRESREGIPQGRLLAVADGSGGEEDQSAARMALETVIRYVLNQMPWYYSLDEEYPEDLRESLEKAFSLCQKRLEMVMASQKSGMVGTTLTLAYVLWPKAYIIHVGDNRAYLYREKKLRQLTTDHTMANKMVEEGILTEKEAETSAYQKFVTNSIAASASDAPRKSKLKPEFLELELQPGDSLFLCSDGLTRHLCDLDIHLALNARRSSQSTCEHLVRTAKLKGGKDNITAVLARFEALSQASGVEKPVSVGSHRHREAQVAIPDEVVEQEIALAPCHWGPGDIILSQSQH